MSGPLISVILPAFNSAEFLRESIESALAQSCRDLEVLVVDDGSTDATPEIAARYEREFPGKVRLLRQENAGPGAARNHALRRAKGSFIAFLDADDVWQPRKLEKQRAALEAAPGAGLVYCDNLFVDRDRREMEGYRRTIRLYSGQVAPELFEHCFIITSSVLITRECARQTGFFREDIRVGEDYDYFLRIAARHRVAFVPEQLYERRMLKEGLSSRNDIVTVGNDILLLTDFLRAEPGFARQYRGRMHRRLGERHFALGYLLLRKGENGRAFGQFAASLRYRASAKTLKCLLLCGLPYRQLQGLRYRGADREAA